MATKQRNTQNDAVVTSTTVLLFVPNLIGYVRIAFALTSFLLMIWQQQRDEPIILRIGSFFAMPLWGVAILLYVGGFVGDLIDGWAARKMNQCSTFGGVMDMVTDRCSTAGLFYILSGEYSKHLGLQLAFLALLLLDVSSHWLQMYSSLALPGSHHHKSDQGNIDKHFLVQWFYKYYWFFGYLCVGTEFTYMLLYVKRQLEIASIFTDDESVTRLVSLLLRVVDVVLIVCIPACVAKQVVNTVQLTSSCVAVAKYDAQAIMEQRKKA